MVKKEVSFLAKVSASFLVTNILFIVEFNFNTNNNIDLSSLALFSIAIPLFIPVIWLYYILEVDEKESNFSYNLLLKNSQLIGYSSIIAFFSSIIAIGIAFSVLNIILAWSFGVGCLIASIIMLYVSFKSEKISSDNYNLLLFPFFNTLDNSHIIQSIYKKD